MKKPIALSGLLLVVVAGTAHATTIVGGNIINQTWTPAGSPYIVQGDITVPAGSTLTIQAGTVVEFASSDGQGAGLDPTRVELTVNGTLAINGTSASPVSLQAQSGNATGTWYGVVIGASATSAVFTNAVISNALFGISSYEAGTVQISDSTIQTSTTGVALLSGTQILERVTITGCTTGVSLQSGTKSLDRLLVTGGGSGIAVTNGAGGTISNVLISGNSGDGLHYDASGSTTLLLTESTIHANNRGVFVGASTGGASADLTIRNSIITGSTQEGVLHDMTGSGISTVATLYSNVFGNGADYSNTAAGVGSISADPLYISPPADLHLQPDSPSIDTGSATNASDHDYDGQLRPLGAQYDMGAFETSGVIFANGFE